MYSVHSRFLVHRSQLFFCFIYHTSFFRLLLSILYSGYATAARPWSCCTALTANFTFSHRMEFYFLFSVLGENYFLFPVLRPTLPSSPHVFWSDWPLVTYLVTYAPIFVENRALFQDRSSFFLKLWHPSPIPLWNVLDVLLSNLHQRGTNL